MMHYLHGGDWGELARRSGLPESEIIDFSANLNPLGPPTCLRPVINRRIEELTRYPAPRAEGLQAALAARYGLDEAGVLAGNGATELIYLLPRICGAHRVVAAIPSYGDYATAARLAGLPLVTVPLAAERGFSLDFAALAKVLQAHDLVFLGQPNNPTGTLLERAALLALVAAHPQVCFAIDESFADFVPGYQPLFLPEPPANLVVIRSLTKFYAIPGLRLGFAVAPPAVAKRLREHLPPWSVNTLAQAVGCAVLQDEAYAERSRRETVRLREALAAGLAALPGLTVYPAVANFLLVRLDHPRLTAADLAAQLLTRGIAVRRCDNFPGLPGAGRGFLRLAVRSERENQLLLTEISLIASNHKVPRRSQSPKRPFALMVQGTSSNAGKSVLVAALGRILLQDGLRVAPFKAQNMSLNSFVTRGGLEMGRAQVVQAQACRLDPEVRMNPVLLKPSSQVGSQVIVNGRPVGNMSVDQYVAYKEPAWQAVTAAYDSLAAEFDGIILEGAGSPAEVNLKHHDIVNMRMARHAAAPVLLVGDIDRGGVFASFVGTLAVMEEWERALVAGFVVNRFRGQASLLDDAYAYVENYCGKPVLGMVPYLERLGLPEEDSVGFKAGLYETAAPATPHVVVGLLDLPHISNFTDFEPLLGEPDVQLVIIRTPADLARQADRLAALLLPGSKNVINDLAWLRESGLATGILALAAAGRTPIIGICGGFQILGQRIDDPHGLEGATGTSVAALGLLPGLVTTLEADKTLSRRQGVHHASGRPLHGYEIHHGISASSLAPALRLAEPEEPAGAASADGLIWGSYLHGLFDADHFRRWFIDDLRQRRHLPPLTAIQYAYDLEPALDRLAAAVRQGLDMERIYRLLDR